MNLGAKPELTPNANINLATPIGALLNLQGMGLDENQESSGVSFETILANASLENEQGVESVSITPQKISPLSLEQGRDIIPSQADEIESSSSQFNHETIVDSPELALNYPTQLQEVAQMDDLPVIPLVPKVELKGAVGEITELVQTKQELPSVVLEAVREFEIENEVNLSEAQLNQVVALVQMKLTPASELVRKRTEQNLEKDELPEIQAQYQPQFQYNEEGEKRAPVVLNEKALENSGILASVVIPANNNFTINPKAAKSEAVKIGNADVNKAKLVINTTLPINGKDIEFIQTGKFFEHLDSEYSQDAIEDSVLTKLTAEPKEAIVLAERAKEPFPIHKISFYQEKNLPVENRSENIAHQVVKVLNNIETKTQSLTIQLEPESLGKIDIKMDISPKGETKVLILAEKLETYALLSKSSDQIQAILTDKGLNQDSTSLNFGLRHGNQHQQQQQQQFAAAEQAFSQDNMGNGEMQVTHLLYSDPNRVDIKA